MSLAAMNWARQQKTGSATRKAVLMAVADYADERGFGWPSQKRLAEDTELSDRTVRTALAELIELGFMERHSKRNSDGTRNTDRLQLRMDGDHRKQLPPDINRKDVPLDQPPENDCRTTGKSRQNHRKMTAEPPEAASAKPFIEPPLEPPKNRSDATASGAVAVAEPVFSEIDACWAQGKLNLQSCGLSAKQSGDMIGSALGRGHSHGDVLRSTHACVEAGTQEPIKYMNGFLRNCRARASPGAGKRSGMLSVLIKDNGLIH